MILQRVTTSPIGLYVPRDTHPHVARQLWMSIFRATHDFGPPDQQAYEAAALALTVLCRFGYFMTFPKCSLKPTADSIFLGVVCDTAQRRFYVPEDKLLKLEAILLEAIVQLSRETGMEMYEYVSSGSTRQSVRAPRLPPGAAFKRSRGHNNVTLIAVSDHRVVRGEGPAK